jgi:tetratricopeptide (TPR) repeat protein
MKTFLLLRNFIGWTKVQFGKILHGEDKNAATRTLMEDIVAEQTIPYGSSLYEAGKKQFEENMDALLQKATKNGVPVLLSELVSNLNGQEPFISLEDKDGQSAKSIFILAQLAEKRGKHDKARQLYIKAKDFDALRFRAPENFNVIIKGLANKYTLPLVPMISYFEKESPDSILGNALFLDHLHPNSIGYHLMAKAFYETMEVNHLISNHWPPSCIEQEQNQGFTDLDSVYGAINIQDLKSGWPFQPKTLPYHFAQNYKPSTLVEEIAFHASTTPDYSLEQGHLDLGDYYAQHGRLDKAFSEYNAALLSAPHEIELYMKAATVLYAKKEYDKAFQLMQKSLFYRETPDVNKWLGAMALMSQKYKEAIPFLKKADSLDAQVIYYLCRAFYLDNQWDNAEEFYLRLKNYAPRSEYFANVTRLRSSLQQNRK